MVQLTLPETKNGHIWEWPAWEWTLPERETTGFAGGKRTMKSEDVEQEEIPLQKRLKSSSLQTTNEMSLNTNESQLLQCVYNLLKEPSPLGLRLKNSQSFMDLLQAKVSQDHIKRGGKNVKAKDVVSGPVDKLKASNFPAVRLRIGHWEYVSKYDADLVAKCYFAKHKLVWEVLDGRLKNKIEIQWGDIVGLKAHCPDNGPGSLTIVLGKEPLFFKETDPLPRKHTVWQPTTDFTGGEASKYRLHYLQCSQGVLNKHYEKLIQCDTRLNFLSQQVDWFSGFPSAAKDSVKDPNVMNNNGSKQLEMSTGPVVSCLKSKSTGPLDLAHGYVECSGLVGSKAIGQVNTHGPHQPMPISNILNHTEHCILEKKPQILLNSMRLAATSDEESLISKVNSQSGFLQDGNESNEYSDPDAGDYRALEWRDGNDHFTPYYDPTPKNENMNGISRVDSLTDLLDQLPDIASLPRLAFDTSQDGEMMDFYSEAVEDVNMTWVYR